MPFGVAQWILMQLLLENIKLKILVFDLNERYSTEKFKMRYPKTTNYCFVNGSLTGGGGGGL